MAVSNASEIGARWARGVQNKEGKFRDGFQRSRQDVLTGLRAIGANPGPGYSAAVTGADAGAAASAWASKVQGKQDKMVRNWLDAISR